MYGMQLRLVLAAACCVGSTTAGLVAKGDVKIGCKDVAAAKADVAFVATGISITMFDCSNPDAVGKVATVPDTNEHLLYYESGTLVSAGVNGLTVYDVKTGSLSQGSSLLHGKKCKGVGAETGVLYSFCDGEKLYVFIEAAWNIFVAKTYALPYKAHVHNIRVGGGFVLLLAEEGLIVYNAISNSYIGMLTAQGKVYSAAILSDYAVLGTAQGIYTIDLANPSKPLAFLRKAADPSVVLDGDEPSSFYWTQPSSMSRARLTSQAVDAVVAVTGSPTAGVRRGEVVYLCTADSFSVVRDDHVPPTSTPLVVVPNTSMPVVAEETFSPSVAPEFTRLPALGPTDFPPTTAPDPSGETASPGPADSERVPEAGSEIDSEVVRLLGGTVEDLRPVAVAATTSAVLVAVAFASSAGAVANGLYVSSLTCVPFDDDVSGSSIPVALHPLRLRVAGSVALGMVVGNLLILACVLALTFALRAFVARHTAAAASSPAPSRMSSVVAAVPLLAIFILYPGIALGSIATVSLSETFPLLPALLALATCLGLPCLMYLGTASRVPSSSAFVTFRSVPSSNRLLTFLIGTGEWTVQPQPWRRTSPLAVGILRRMPVLTCGRPAVGDYIDRSVQFPVLQCAAALGLSLAAGIAAPGRVPCAALKVVSGVVFLCLAAAGLFFRPHVCAKDAVADGMVGVFGATSSVFAAAAVGLAGDAPPGDREKLLMWLSGRALGIAWGALIVRVVLVVAGAVVKEWAKPRHSLAAPPPEPHGAAVGGYCPADDEPCPDSPWDPTDPFTKYRSGGSGHPPSPSAPPAPASFSAVPAAPLAAGRAPFDAKAACGDPAVRAGEIHGAGTGAEAGQTSRGARDGRGMMSSPSQEMMSSREMMSSPSREMTMSSPTREMMMSSREMMSSPSREMMSSPSRDMTSSREMMSSKEIMWSPSPSREMTMAPRSDSPPADRRHGLGEMDEKAIAAELVKRLHCAGGGVPGVDLHRTETISTIFDALSAQSADATARALLSSTAQAARTGTAAQRPAEPTARDSAGSLAVSSCNSAADADWKRASPPPGDRTDKALAEVIKRLQAGGGGGGGNPQGGGADLWQTDTLSTLFDALSAWSGDATNRTMQTTAKGERPATPQSGANPGRVSYPHEGIHSPQRRPPRCQPGPDASESAAIEAWEYRVKTAAGPPAASEAASVSTLSACSTLNSQPDSLKGPPRPPVPHPFLPPPSTQPPGSPEGTPPKGSEARLVSPRARPAAENAGESPGKQRGSVIQSLANLFHGGFGGKQGEPQEQQHQQHQHQQHPQQHQQQHQQQQEYPQHQQQQQYQQQFSRNAYSPPTSPSAPKRRASSDYCVPSTLLSQQQQQQQQQQDAASPPTSPKPARNRRPPPPTSSASLLMMKSADQNAPASPSAAPRPRPGPAAGGDFFPAGSPPTSPKKPPNPQTPMLLPVAVAPPAQQQQQQQARHSKPARDAAWSPPASPKILANPASPMLPPGHASPPASPASSAHSPESLLRRRSLGPSPLMFNAHSPRHSKSSLYDGASNPGSPAMPSAVSPPRRRSSKAPSPIFPASGAAPPASAGAPHGRRSSLTLFDSPPESPDAARSGRMPSGDPFQMLPPAVVAVPCTADPPSPSSPGMQCPGTPHGIISRQQPFPGGRNTIILKAVAPFANEQSAIKPPPLVATSPEAPAEGHRRRSWRQSIPGMTELRAFSFSGDTAPAPG
ncbi:hypothetical protein DIPPA_33513 [Diplonema papillatum]|nr:hypothetical protein DIPPA_33513 [Diplonema papillatum]